MFHIPLVKERHGVAIWIFRAVPNNKCPLLKEKKLQDLTKTWGEESADLTLVFLLILNDVFKGLLEIVIGCIKIFTATSYVKQKHYKCN